MTTVRTPPPGLLNREGIIAAPTLARECGVAAFSLTRMVSDYRGVSRADTVADLKARRLVPPDSKPRFAHQVHSAQLDIGQPIHERQGGWWESSECDGLTSDCAGAPAGQPLVILTADCCPVVLAGRKADGGSWYAALHAGWRGTMAGIVTRGIMAARDAGVCFSGLHVWIGPHISESKYEVSEELIRDFLTRHGGVGKFHRARNLDLGKLNALQARLAGIPEELVHTSELCTFSNPDLFPSYRRDGRCNGQVLTIVYPLGK